MAFLIHTTDNNCSNCIVNRDGADALSCIAGQTLDALDSQKHVLIFPKVLAKSDGDIGKQSVFELKNRDDHVYALTTGNVMGFIGVNDIQLRICSRFAKDDAHDYFLHYLLSRVFSLNMFDLKYSSLNDGIFNLLYYVFVYHLRCAWAQGIYKTYIRHSYSDARLRGCIDITRQIKLNQPFCGNIAYQIRERSEQNALMMLIRHAIEIILGMPFGKTLLNADKDIQAAVQMVVGATPDYRVRDRMRVLRDNSRDVKHPYLTAYAPLQRVARMIVSGQTQNYGASRDEVYGVLFDGAWLWEQYLAKLLEPLGFEHPDNISGKKPIYLFEDCQGFRRYPDFIDKQKCIILDAKYKHMEDKHGDAVERSKSYDRNDLHQLITYMYITRARKSGFIYPAGELTRRVSIGHLCGYGGEMFKIGLKIPENAHDMDDFCMLMQAEEQSAVKILKSLDVEIRKCV